MILRAIIIAIVLACLTIVAAVFKLGSGGMLFLAILGPSAVWLLPGPFVHALPIGAFGSVLFAKAEQALRDMTYESPTAETLRLAVVAMVLSTLVSGWVVPLAPQHVEQEFSRFRDSTAAPEQDDARPRTLMLDELILRMNSVPGAWQELLRRFMWIAASFLMPLLAVVLVSVKSRWTQGEAAAATLAVFIISFQLLSGGSFL